MSEKFTQASIATLRGLIANETTDSRRTLAGYLLRGFADDDFPGLELVDEPSSAALQIKDMYDATPDIQEPLRQAVSRGIRDWSLAAHGASALIGLGHLAAFVGASGAVLPLTAAFERVLKSHGPHDTGPSDVEIQAAIVNVIAGFSIAAPGDDVRYAADKWLHREDLSPNLVGQIFLSAVRSSPQDLPSFLPRLLHFANSDSPPPNFSAILRRMVRDLGISVVLRELPRFEMGAGAVVAEQIFGSPDPLATIVHRDDHAFIVKDRRGTLYTMAYDQQQMAHVRIVLLPYYRLPTAAVSLKQVAELLHRPDQLLSGVTDVSRVPPRPEWGLIPQRDSHDN